MANHKSALKRHRQSEKRAVRNRAQRTRVKNVIKSVRTAIAEKDFDKASTALVDATSVIDKSSTKGALHWKTAARKVSRLAKALNAAKVA